MKRLRMPNKNDLTQEQLKSQLEYDPLTGLFRRVVSTTYNCKVGWFRGSPSSGYMLISVLGWLYPAHQLAWLFTYGVWGIPQIDHENGRRWDNRIENLSVATRLQNQRNMTIPVNNTTGRIGVYRVKLKRGDRWAAAIHVSDKKIHLGHFSTFDEAVTARQIAEADYGFNPNHSKDRQPLQPPEREQAS